MNSGLKRKNRKRGGQKGNQNARKHGFYSAKMSPEEACRYLKIMREERIDPEMAVLRVKLEGLTEQGPVNRRVLKEAARVIVKWSTKKYGLDRESRSYLKAGLELTFERSAGISLGKPGRLSEIIENYEQKEIIRNLEKCTGHCSPGKIRDTFAAG